MLTNTFVEETTFLYLVIYFLMLLLVSILLCWESVLQADAELQKRAKVNFMTFSVPYKLRIIWHSLWVFI